MGTATDFNEEFKKYFYELEGFATRAERFYDDCGEANHKLLERWIHAAFLAGAKSAADDAVATLRDYATAVAGLDDMITSEQGYDDAAEGLDVYFSEVLAEAEQN